MNKQFFHTSESVTVDNYPYGRLKCEATFGLEYNPKKGFRSVFQTVNPKNGTINKPKKSVYHPIMLMYRNTENGYIEYEAPRLWEGKDVNKVSKFIHDNFSKFSEEQIKDISAHLFNHLVIDLVFRVRNETAEVKAEVKATKYQATLNLLKLGMSGENIFAEVNFERG